MQKHLAILAIDSQSGNLKGAQKRSANLEVSLQKLFIPFIKLHNEIKMDVEIIYVFLVEFKTRPEKKEFFKKFIHTVQCVSEFYTPLAFCCKSE